MKFRILIAGVMAIAAGAIFVGAQTPTETVHQITLPRYQPNLPSGPGRQAFATACLGCHTDRYIATQPPFPAAKWEAEVKKMVATYGCYVTDDQVSDIAQYCVFLQKSPEGRTISPVPLPEPGPHVQAAWNDESKSAGQALFAKDCQTCHVAALHSSIKNKLGLPLPSDLSTIAYSSQTLSAAIHNSVPGTAMPAFANLDNQDLQALMVYVQSLAPMPEHVTASDEGKKLYMTNCLSCHGQVGAGDGFAAAALPRPAANFTAEQPTADFAYQAITNGIPGTSMPQWKTKFTDAQRHELAQYVRSLFHFPK